MYKNWSVNVIKNLSYWFEKEPSQKNEEWRFDELGSQWIITKSFSNEARDWFSQT